MAAPKTSASVPPTATFTGLVVEKVELAGICTPKGAAGVVGPKPVPQRMITSPGFAGVVALPSVPFFTASVKSWRVATGYFPPQRKNAGSTEFEFTVAAALVPPVAVL